MTAVLVGILAIAVGLLLCVRGAHVLRLLIAVWSALAGFVVGGATVAALTGDTFLGGALALTVAAASAVIAGAVAYTFFVVAILIAMAAIGFTLGTDLTVALGVRWSWLIVAVGALLGLVLAALAVAGDLPMVVLVVLSATAGASTVITGLMLVFGTVSLESLTSAVTTQRLDDSWWWYLVYLLLAAAGCVMQLRSVQGWTNPVRTQWHRSQHSRGPVSAPGLGDRGAGGSQIR